ncbi:MAG TPA: hypothetical protein VGS23_00355 [Thermoplasmata archaeon]|nr:hypothetical protein [Thermoplasmata archaeon]
MNGDVVSRMSGWLTRFRAGGERVMVLLYLGFAAIVRELMTGTRSIRRSHDGRNWAHTTVFILGLAVLLFGIVYLIIAGGFYTPTPLILLALGLGLIVLGLLEVGVEEERGARGRRE